ncbi:MAG: hypothetical protein NTU94_05015 [Planctomycetota bacterium]|nr:hypothetical protein [Planctomycetota bacterium]
MEPLIDNLKRVRRRLLLVRALETGLAGAIGASAFAAVVTLIRIFLPQYVPVASAHPALPLGLVACGFAIGFVVRLIKGVSLREAAIAADRAAGLKERLATALEVFESGDQALSPGGMPPVPLGGHASGQGSNMPSQRHAGHATHRPGLLDDRLLEQARAAAAPLDPSRLVLGRTLGRLAKAAMVAVFVLVAGAFVPSVGGPPLAPQAAERAALALDRLARQGSVAPVVREKIEEAVAKLRQAGPRQGAADKATEAVYEAVARVESARREALKALVQVNNREFQKMIRDAAKGDAEAAAGAAKDLADKLDASAASGGMPLADRERLADGLTGAAAAVDPKDLAELAKDLAAAAEAVRRGESGAGEKLKQLADRITKQLGEKPGGGVAAVVQAVGEARRTLGLAESPPAELTQPGTLPGRIGPEPAPAASGTASAPMTAGQEVGPSSPAAIPAEVRPEDRDVVRRYFGG